jgi:hypothetical protein
MRAEGGVVSSASQWDGCDAATFVWINHCSCSDYESTVVVGYDIAVDDF